MPYEKAAPSDMLPFARNIVRKLVRDKGLKWNSHRIEDAESTLYLAGVQVWAETGDVGLAKNRMMSRRNNLLRDDKSERKRPTQSRYVVQPGSKGGRDEEVDIVALRADRRTNPVEEAEYNEFIESLDDQLRTFFLLKYAAHTHEEIAAKMSVGLRTVERMAAQVKEAYKAYSE